ncbi:protein kinase domain-containing protein [Actinomadura nitritigenes]|uniref:protein kinase domain-containing protein n=1 Tax=Actinomadura nitritigenes TaxID=134602 RepID=UPI003D8C1BA2
MRVYLGPSKGGQPVAVKVIHPYLAEDTQFWGRSEAKVTTVQRVEASTPCRWWGPRRRRSALAGDRVHHGPSLHEALGEHDAFSAAGGRGARRGLAEGLMVVDEQGDVQRDLKAGNVLLAQESPRIIDFGIARALDATLRGPRLPRRQ